MTISLTHGFVSAIADDSVAAAAGEVLPSHWNAQHTLTQATAALLGRGTAGTGATEEITLTNDTNVTATLSAGNLAFGWTGTLAAGRLNANVVQSVVNDTNVTGSISAQALTLAWTGTLAVGRGGIGVGTLTLNGVLYGNGTSAIQATAQGGANTVLSANAGAPSFTASPVIGTSVTTPLHIGGSAANSTVTLESTSGIGTSDMILFKTGSQVEASRIDTSGNTILGGAAAQGPYRFEQHGISAAGATHSLWDWTTDANPANFYFLKSRGAAIGTLTALTSGDAIGLVDFFGTDATATPVFREAVYIKALADAAPTAGSVPGRLTFGTSASGNATATECMRIDSTGKVQISYGGFGNILSGALEVHANTGVSHNVTMIAYGANNFNNDFVWAKTRGTTPTTQTIVQAGDTLGALLWRGSDGAAFQHSSAVIGTVDGTPGAGSMPGKINFSTTPSGSTTRVTRFTIDSTGLASFTSTAGFGYATAANGDGGAVTQLTSRTTGVTLNNVCGAITMFSAAGSATAATFTVTNSKVAATDVILLSVKSATNLYNMLVTAVAAGSFNITFFTTGGTSTDAPVINFTVIKAVAT